MKCYLLFVSIVAAFLILSRSALALNCDGWSIVEENTVIHDYICICQECSSCEGKGDVVIYRRILNCFEGTMPCDGGTCIGDSITEIDECSCDWCSCSMNTNHQSQICHRCSLDPFPVH